MTSRNEESRSGSWNSMQIGAEGRKGLWGHGVQACRHGLRIPLPTGSRPARWPGEEGSAGGTSRRAQAPSNWQQIWNSCFLPFQKTGTIYQKRCQVFRWYFLFLLVLLEESSANCYSTYISTMSRTCLAPHALCVIVLHTWHTCTSPPCSWLSPPSRGRCRQHFLLPPPRVWPLTISSCLHQCGSRLGKCWYRLGPKFFFIFWNRLCWHIICIP